jgi:uncharacterized membrane-anchored protein
MTKNRITMNAVVMILIVSVLVLTNSKLIHAESIEILNLNVDPATVMVGDTFSINASILNNSTNTISVHNSCGGSFSILFDNHATVNMEKVCNWMPIQIILNPGENATLTSFASNLTYNASSSGTVNANVTLSYDIINQINPDLSNTDNIISKLLVFTIYDKNSQTEEEHLTILSPLKQFKSGIDAKDIQCKNGLELIIKVKNNFPACVKQNTVSKIVLLGWIKLMQDNLSEKDESSTRIITLEDDGKSISLKADQSFLLKLGEDFEWNIEIDNQTVVSRALNIMVVRGAQGVYESHIPGHATLTAVGDPPCLHSEPPCRMHSILFTLDIEVLQ